MADLPSYPSISNPAAFHEWISGFKCKAGWVHPSKAPKSAAYMHPVAETLQSIAKINVQRGTPAILELNVLYACYMASRAPAPECDPHAETRIALSKEQEQRPKALSALKELQDYLAQNKWVALRAMTQSDSGDKKPVLWPTTNSAERIAVLETLLTDFESALLDLNVDDERIALISSSDYVYGPFDFDFDLNISWKSKGTSGSDTGKNIIQTGLMFHLTYLFKYFTCEVVPKTAAFFHNDILILDGVRMLNAGDSHRPLVAALTNAVFDAKFSSRDVKDRLDALIEPTSGSKRGKNPHFIGW